MVDLDQHVSSFIVKNVIEESDGFKFSGSIKTPVLCGHIITTRYEGVLKNEELKLHILINNNSHTYIWPDKITSMAELNVALMNFSRWKKA